MNTIVIPINNQEIIKTYTVSKLEISVSSITLFESVTLSVFLKDINDNIIDIYHLTLEKEQYNEWGNNDDYIIDLILSKYNFSKII